MARANTVHMGCGGRNSDTSSARQGASVVLALWAPLLLVSGGVGCAQLAATPVEDLLSAGPHLEAVETAHDFGTAGQNKTISHKFIIRNTGTEAVKVAELRTSCGCTAALLSHETIGPGQFAEIEASFETRRSVGRQEHHVTVLSNAKNSPELRLSIAGMVRSGVALDPQVLDFGNLEVNQAATEVIRLLQLSDQRIDIHKVESEEGRYEISISRFRSDQQLGIELQVTLKTGALVGPVQDVITLHTGIDDEPRVEVFVLADIRGPIKIEPVSYSLGSVTSGASLTQLLVLTSTDDVPFRVLGIESDLPFIQFRSSPAGAALRVEITAEVNIEGPAGMISGRIDFIIDRKGQERISIPVTGMISADLPSPVPLLSAILPD